MTVDLSSDPALPPDPPLLSRLETEQRLLGLARELTAARGRLPANPIPDLHDLMHAAPELSEAWGRGSLRVTMAHPSYSYHAAAQALMGILPADIALTVARFLVQLGYTTLRGDDYSSTPAWFTWNAEHHRNTYNLIRWAGGVRYHDARKWGRVRDLKLLSFGSYGSWAWGRRFTDYFSEGAQRAPMLEGGFYLSSLDFLGKHMSPDWAEAYLAWLKGVDALFGRHPVAQGYKPAAALAKEVLVLWEATEAELFRPGCPRPLPWITDLCDQSGHWPEAVA